MLRNKGAHIGVLCHDDHTSIFEYLPLGFIDGNNSLYAFFLTVPDRSSTYLTTSSI